VRFQGRVYVYSKVSVVIDNVSRQVHLDARLYYK
jgi:hypothetical protein